MGCAQHGAEPRMDAASWMAPPEGWAPVIGWQPDPNWPPVPAGHQWWQAAGQGASRRTTAIGLVAVSSATEFLLGIYGLVVRTLQSRGLHGGTAGQPHSVGIDLLLVNVWFVLDAVGHSGRRNRGGRPMGSEQVGSCAHDGIHLRSGHWRMRRSLGRSERAITRADPVVVLVARRSGLVRPHVCTRDRRVRRHREAAQAAWRYIARTATRLGSLSAVPSTRTNPPMLAQSHSAAADTIVRLSHWPVARQLLPSSQTPGTMRRSRTAPPSSAARAC